MEPGEVDNLLACAADAAANAHLVVGSGSLPPGCPDDFYAHLVQIAHDRHLPCLIDASGSALLRAAEAGADLVKPNAAEAVAATGAADPFAGASDLLARGAARVLLSDGERGMFDLVAGEPTLHGTPGRVLSGNATGAGDAAVAAAATALTSGDDRDALVIRATAWSAAAVTMPAAGDLPDDPDAWIDSVRLTTHHGRPD